MYHTQAYLCFSVVSFKFTSFKSVGRKKMTILYRFVAFLTISRRKMHYEVSKSSDMHF